MTNAQEDEKKPWFGLAKIIDALSGVVADILFVALPLVVLSMVGIYQGQSRWQILSLPEWSFVAAILLGHSIVKFVGGVVSVRYRTRQQIVALIVTLSIVFGLVPSLVVMTLVLLSNNKPSDALVWSQIGLTVMGVVAFLLLGTTGHLFLEQRLQLEARLKLEEDKQKSNASGRAGGDSN